MSIFNSTVIVLFVYVSVLENVERKHLDSLKFFYSLYLTFFFFLQFDNDYEEFKQNIEGLKAALQNFVASWFDKSLSVSAIP